MRTPSATALIGSDRHHAGPPSTDREPRCLGAHRPLRAPYDGNGGFFDHVAPPTAGPDDDGEWIPGDVAQRYGGTTREGLAIAGPIGLGFRVPCLVVSPLTRGGLVATDRFDHTSLLRFTETLFEVPVPDRDPTGQHAGLSAWRRSTVGDLTSAFDFPHPAPADPLDLPDLEWPDPREAIHEAGDFVRSWLGQLPPYDVPPNQLPHQAGEPARRRVPPDPGQPRA